MPISFASERTYVPLEQNTFQTYISNSNTDFILRWKDFVESTIPVVGSTDAPFNNTVCGYSPFRVIYQAVTRRGYIDRTHASWELNQRIAIEDALRLLTIGGAWATKEEDKKGNLEPGKYADLIVVSGDPLTVAMPEDLLSIHTLLTMVGGEIEYCTDNIPLFCEPAIAFVVDSMMVTVSNYVADQKPGKAFDKNEETNWGAGGGPPQYIQVDFLKNTLLDRIELVVEQFPAGFTRHQLLAAPVGQSLNPEVLHEFAGNTASLETLAFDFNASGNNFRYIKIATLQSPSWVAWREIRLFKEGSTEVTTFKKDEAGEVKIYPTVATNMLILETKRGWPGETTINIINPTGEFMQCEKIKDLEKIKIDVSALTPGIYFVEIRNGSRAVTRKFVIR